MALTTVTSLAEAYTSDAPTIESEREEKLAAFEQMERAKATSETEKTVKTQEDSENEGEAEVGADTREVAGNGEHSSGPVDEDNAADDKQD